MGKSQRPPGLQSCTWCIAPAGTLGFSSHTHHWMQSMINPSYPWGIGLLIKGFFFFFPTAILLLLLLFSFLVFFSFLLFLLIPKHLSILVPHYVQNKGPFFNNNLAVRKSNNIFLLFLSCLAMDQKYIIPVPNPVRIHLWRTVTALLLLLKSCQND